MVANDCKAIPNMIPSKWDFKMFDECPSNNFSFDFYVYKQKLQDIMILTHLYNSLNLLIHI